jgi:pimeloyl-ACP methyl ester carboxylesterase
LRGMVTRDAEETIGVESADGVSIVVRKRGGDGTTEPGKTVLLAHANGFHGGVFAPMMDAFVAAGYACYALDFRGHGKSGRAVKGEYTWKALTDDCAAVVTALGLHGCHAFGHSCGGHALLMCEARRPGTFRSVYAFEPIFIVSPEALPGMDVSPGSPLMASTAYMVKSASRRRSTFANAAEALKAYKSKLPMSAWNADALDAYVNKGGFVDDPNGAGVTLACTSETEISIYQAGDKETEAFGKLNKVSCPVVIAKGTSFASDGKSPIYSAVIAPAIAREVRRGTLVEFPDNSHLGPMEIPLKVAQSALDFIAGVGDARQISKL